MEKEELLELWSKKIVDAVRHEDGSKMHAAVLEVLSGVFEVGRETGKDEEKLAHQLHSLGKPHGHEGQ